MRHYEILCLIQSDLSEDRYKELLAKIQGSIEAAKGQVIKVDEWGRRDLAYEVKGYQTGVYVLVEFCSEPEFPAELKREFNLDERVLEFQTIQLGKHADPEALRRKVREAQGPEEEAAEVSEPQEPASEVQDGIQ